MSTVFLIFLPVILALIFVALLAFPWRYACRCHNQSQLNKAAPNEQLLVERLVSNSLAGECFAGEYFLACTLTDLHQQADKPEHANDKELAAIIVHLESALTEAHINLWIGDHGTTDMIVSTAYDELVKYNQAQLKKQQNAGIAAPSQ